MAFNIQCHTHAWQETHCKRPSLCTCCSLGSNHSKCIIALLICSQTNKCRWALTMFSTHNTWDQNHLNSSFTVSSIWLKVSLALGTVSCIYLWDKVTSWFSRQIWKALKENSSVSIQDKNLRFPSLFQTLINLLQRTPSHTWWPLAQGFVSASKIYQ